MVFAILATIATIAHRIAVHAANAQAAKSNMMAAVATAAL